MFIWNNASWFKRLGFIITAVGCALPVLDVLWTGRIQRAQRVAEIIGRRVIEPPAQVSREPTDAAYWDWFNKAEGRVILAGFLVYGALFFAPVLWFAHLVSDRYPAVESSSLRLGHELLRKTGLVGWLLDGVGWVLLVLIMVALLNLYARLLRVALLLSQSTLYGFARAEVFRIINVAAAILVVIGAYFLMAPK